MVDHQSPSPRERGGSRRAFGAARATRRQMTARIGSGAVLLAAFATWAPPALRAIAAPVGGSAPLPVAHLEESGEAARALVPEAVGPLLQLYPAGALHVVGVERFALGVVDAETGPIEDAKLALLFFKIVNNQGTLAETLPAPFLPYGVQEGHEDGHEHHAGEVTGIYVARPTFDTAGSWGVVARVSMPDGSVRAGQVAFEVAADTDLPGPGDPAIASKTAVATTPEEIARICTADPVDDMHGISLDEALSNGKPTVLLFATPALCTSRVCGPSLEAVEALENQYGDQANFLHVEIYPERDYNKPAAAVEEWHLPSEPWLFLIDGAGTVVERYEGGIGLTELAPAVQQLVAGGA